MSQLVFPPLDVCLRQDSYQPALLSSWPRLLFGLWSGGWWAFCCLPLPFVGPACLWEVFFSCERIILPSLLAFVSFPFPCSNHAATPPTQREKQGTGRGVAAIDGGRQELLLLEEGGLTSVAGGRRRRRRRREASPALQDGGLGGITGGRRRRRRRRDGFATSED
jgi:hypothetical protein